MKAACWTATRTITVQDVPDPTIRNEADAIVRVTSTAICGSDLHLYDHYVPGLKSGDVPGHEFMGEVVEVGPAVRRVKVGDRVVVPFPIACGACVPCQRDETSLCENTNVTSPRAETLWGHSPAAIFGYSHLLGGYAGGQAEYVRVPFADVGPLRIEDDALTDDQVLFLSDVLPTGYMGAELCDIGPGDVVAVWGAGSVGHFAAASAQLMGADRVIVIDRVPERLDLARQQLGAEVLDFEAVDVLDALKDMTGGRGPDACIDAVGHEATHPTPAVQAYDKAKQLTRMQTDRGGALREVIMACRNGGHVSIMGVYGGIMDAFPVGSLMNRSLTVRTGQCHVHRYMRPLLQHIQAGDLDPTAIISHHLSLEQAPEGYDMFKHKTDGCTKVVLTT